MDTHEYNYWVQRTRLRSARHKKRMQYEDDDKALIQKHKEEKAVWFEMRNLGWTELKPPVQRGFIRFFILRSDVARTKEAPFFLKILEKINTSQWSSRKDFKKKRRRFGKKVYMVREQRLADASETDFANKFSEKEKLCFYEVLVHYGKSKIPVKVYRLTETWRFVLRVRPNMITKVRVKDLDLEKRKSELNRFFNHERRLRLTKLLYGDTYKWNHRPGDNLGNPLHNKSFTSVLDEHWPDRESKALYRNPREIEGFSFYISSRFDLVHET